MVAEQHPAVGGDEIPPVVEPLGGGGPAVVQAEDTGGEEPGIEAVADRVGAEGGREEPGGIDRLAAVERQHPERRRTEPGYPAPHEHGGESSHAG